MAPTLLWEKEGCKALQCTIGRCGLKIAKLGSTFQSDHLKANGEACESSLDHIYYSSDLEKKIITTTLKNSLSDHLPVICEVRSIPKILPHTRKVTKRCLKDFSEDKWNDCLSKKDWSKLENCNMVDDMVDIPCNSNLNLPNLLGQCTLTHVSIDTVYFSAISSSL